MDRIQTLRTSIERKQGEKFGLESQIIHLTKAVKYGGRNLRQCEQAKAILQQVGLETQQQLQYQISDVTSLALDAVFDDPYELIADFVERRNQSECDLYFQRDGERFLPKDGSGVGAIDVAAFALRVACWSMQTPKRRNTIILDEPMKHLSTDHQEAASRVLKEISDRLGIQFIIITHEQVLAEYADKTFKVNLRKGVSQIKVESVTEVERNNGTETSS